MFVNVTINGKTSIFLDHINTWVASTFPTFMMYFALVMTVIGVFVPFYRKTWRKNSYNTFFALAGFLSIPTAIMFTLNKGPAFLMAPDVIPNFYTSIIIPWSLVIITGSVAVSFLANFGLFEFVGVFAQPFMRKIYKLPGLAAVNCIACFIGSFTVGTIVTNNLYKEGKYSQREAVILLTGFGTVSATFMLIQARLGGLMNIWNTFFWSCLLVTCLVSVVTCRLWPVTTVSDTYYNDKPYQEKEYEGNIFQIAANEGLTVCAHSDSLLKTLKNSMIQAANMIWGLMPTMGSVAIVAICILKYTPFFDYIGYLFYPITALMRLPEAAIAAKAVGFTLVDVVIPCMMVGEFELLTRFVVCVTAVSQIIFFCGSLPCFLASDIDFSMPKYLLVAVYRIILSVIFATLLGLLIF